MRLRERVPGRSRGLAAGGSPRASFRLTATRGRATYVTVAVFTASVTARSTHKNATTAREGAH